jgi:phosphate-selective porin OprO and OprP
MRLATKLAGSAAMLAVLGAGGTAFAQATPSTATDWTTGSPRYTSDDGQFQFKLRGRMQVDLYNVSADFDERTGASSRDENALRTAVRRGRIGVDGRFNTVFRYRAELEVAGGQANWADIYLEHVGDAGSLFIGNHYQSTSMDGLSSSVNLMLNERSLMTNAFGRASRHLGVAYRRAFDKGSLVVGVYGDSINNTETANQNEPRFVEARYTYALTADRGNTTAFGASVRYRDRGDAGLFGYSTRPSQINYGTSFLASGSVAETDLTIGVEGFLSRGSFSLAGEYQALQADNPTIGDLSFSGGYIEASYWLTGETRPYSVANGSIGGIRPNSPMQEGGFGAWGVVGRLDYLDLSDGNLGAPTNPVSSFRTVGGEATAYTVGLVWQPTDWVMFRGTYAYTDFSDTRGFLVDPNNPASLVSDPLGNGDAQVFNLRAQFSF